MSTVVVEEILEDLRKTHSINSEVLTRGTNYGEFVGVTSISITLAEVL